jgi:hypothetical protein
VAEHVLAAADRWAPLDAGRAGEPIPAAADGFVDEARAARWNVAAAEVLAEG